MLSALRSYAIVHGTSFVVRGSEDPILVFLPLQCVASAPAVAMTTTPPHEKKIIPRVDARPTRVVF